MGRTAEGWSEALGGLGLGVSLPDGLVGREFRRDRF